MAVPLSRRRTTPQDLPAAIHEAVSPPLALDRPPLLRAALLELAPWDVVLVVAVHHAVIDGWSLHLLDEEFSDLHQVALAGRRLARSISPRSDQCG
ncbi:condensation domain-containing protein [Streptomyces sp. NPDC050428]|uniref:condensation domain-containing protein n=1 Tax=Streptomyces sp. NPDC050428 TaxID=3155757 RepID=UPI003422DEA6